MTKLQTPNVPMPDIDGSKANPRRRPTRFPDLRTGGRQPPRKFEGDDSDDVPARRRDIPYPPLREGPIMPNKPKADPADDPDARMLDGHPGDDQPLFGCRSAGRRMSGQLRDRGIAVEPNATTGFPELGFARSIHAF